MAAILIFIAVCLVLALIGMVATNKISKDTGVYAIGGPNGGVASSFLRKHPNVSAVYEKMEYGGKSEQTIQQLLQMGAKAVITPQIGDGMLVLMEDAAIAFGNTGGAAHGTKGQLFYPMNRCDGYLRKEEIKFKVEAGKETTKAKDKSVIGSAVVGSIVAGGVGAVVGAIAAANHNTNNREVTTIKYETRGTGIDIAYLQFKDGNGKLYLDNVYVGNDINVNITSVYGAIKRIIEIIDKREYQRNDPATLAKVESPVNETKIESPVSKPKTTLPANEPKAESKTVASQQEILDYLAKHPRSTVVEIREGCPSLRDRPTIETSRLLRILYEEKKITRHEDDAAYFYLAGADTSFSELTEEDKIAQQREVMDYLAGHPRSTTAEIKMGCPSLRKRPHIETVLALSTLIGEKKITRIKGETSNEEEGPSYYFSLK